MKQQWRLGSITNRRGAHHLWPASLSSKACQHRDWTMEYNSLARKRTVSSLKKHQQQNEQPLTKNLHLVERLYTAEQNQHTTTSKKRRVEGEPPLSSTCEEMTMVFPEPYAFIWAIPTSLFPITFNSRSTAWWRNKSWHQSLDKTKWCHGVRKVEINGYLCNEFWSVLRPLQWRALVMTSLCFVLVRWSFYRWWFGENALIWRCSENCPWLSDLIRFGPHNNDRSPET